jgi:hypothetical protein
MVGAPARDVHRMAMPIVALERIIRSRVAVHATGMCKDRRKLSKCFDSLLILGGRFSSKSHTQD